MTRLFIEENEVDLTSELSQQITFAIDDIRKIDSKATTYSKTIVLPGTQLNNRIFGNIYELARSNDEIGTGPNAFFSFDPTRSASARLEVNGLLIMKGIARLLLIRRDREAIEYEVSLFGELGGFISSVGNRKLEELDFSRYNHQWNESNIRQTWPNFGSTFSGTVVILGPFTSLNYNPQVDYIQFSFNGIINGLGPGDEFTVINTASNNGTFKALDVIYKESTNETKILVQYFPPDPFNPETATATIEKLKWGGNGYVYPLIDYGVAQPASFPLNHDFRHLRPALFVREYLDKIITQAGFTFSSEFMDTPFFRRLIIPNNDERLEKRGTTQYINADCTDEFHEYNRPIGGQDTYRIYSALNWDTINTASSFTFSAISGVSNGKFTFTGATDASIKISIRLNLRIVNFEFFSSVKFTLKRKRGSTIDNLFEGRTYTEASIVTEEEIDVNIMVQNGDEFWVEIYIRLEWVGSIPFRQVGIYSDDRISTLRVDQDPPGFLPYAYNDKLEINNTIPKNVLQRDFFLSVVKMFNLMITDDPLKDKHLIITPYIDFYDPDPDKYIEWSYKVARDKQWQIKPMSEANARIYDFKYKDDNDYFNETYRKKWNETYGNKVFDNDLEFSKDRSAVEVIFSPSILVGYEDELKIFPAIYKFEQSSNTKTPQGHNIRIMQIKYFDELEESWQIFNGATAVSGAINDYLYCGHFDDPNDVVIDLNWGITRELFYTVPSIGLMQNNLFYIFYSPYMAEIVNRDSKLLTCETYLNEKDIFNLDFRRLIMLDGVLFRLQKIIDWTVGELCKTELLRVINTSYPAIVGSTRFLKLTFLDLPTAGMPTTLAGWNTLFNLPTLGVPFSLLQIQGNEVYLYGGQDIELKAQIFRNNSRLTRIEDFSKVIKFLNSKVCENCTSLYHVNLPKVTADDGFAFGGCTALTEVNMPSLDFGDRTFFNCPALETIRLPKLRDANQTFRECTSLKYVDLPIIDKIGSDCFLSCSSLEKAIFPSATSVGDAAFFKCFALTEIYLPNVAPFIGGSPDDNQVFEQITGNNINATFNISLQTINSGSPDDDVVYLDSNNTVTITYV